MEKKTIFLELSAEMVDKIDKQNIMGDRSTFISDLLDKQLQQSVSTMDASTEITSTMDADQNKMDVTSSEFTIVNSRGVSLGRFDLDTVEGFEQLAKKISEISNDPIVKIRARSWF